MGNETASSAPTKPPIELPITTGLSIPELRRRPCRPCAAKPGIEISSSGIGDWPKPGMSIATQRWVPMNAGMFSSQFCQNAAEAVEPQQRRPVAAGVDHAHLAPATSSRLVIAGQSTVIQVASSPSA